MLLGPDIANLSGDITPGGAGYTCNSAGPNDFRVTFHGTTQQFSAFVNGTLAGGATVPGTLNINTVDFACYGQDAGTATVDNFAAVPEPAGLSLPAVAGAAMIGLRPRRRGR